MRPVFLFLLPVLLACSSPTAEHATTTSAPSGAALLETFEAGAKGAYAPATETLGSGPWRFEEALIGSSPQDHKHGQHAARLRGTGRLTMLFDAPAGVRRIQVSAAAYGDDAPSTWELWLSRDGGRRYERVGQPIVSRGPRLQTLSFAGLAGEPVRLEIRKTNPGDTRLNIDDISLENTPGPAVSTPPVASQQPIPKNQKPITNNQQPSTKHQAPGTKDDHLALGNPSGATSDPNNPTHYLLRRPEYAIGYNARRGTPTWTCWHLSRAWLGQAPRQDDFRPDPALPREFYAVTPKSYAGSGFDKGHNCPSGDRTADLDANSATFLMSNMVPQAPQNNQQTWNHLEAWTREQIDQGQEAYVLMGSYGRGGTGTHGPAQTLDQGRVTVPARIWKVIVLLPAGDNDLQRLAAGQGRVVAVDTPNDNAINPDWQQYRTSVDKIEAATGLDLLSALPAAVQARLQK